MDMQPIDGVFIKSVKDRQNELGYIFRDAYHQIQYKLNVHTRRMKAAKQREMSRDEFNTLFPAPQEYIDALTGIDADKATLAALEIEVAAWQTLYSAVDHEDSEAREEFFTEHGKKPRTEDGRPVGRVSYDIRAAEKPFTPWLPQTDITRIFSDADFIALYPKPAHDSYIEQHTIINDSRNESTALQAFLKSGVNGLHDVDLLTGTAIGYP